MRTLTQNDYRKMHIGKTMQDLRINRKEYKRFLIIGNKLHRFYEFNCNGYIGSEAIYSGNKIINEYTEKQYKADTTPLYKKAKAMAREKGLFIFFQTDPRGATIYLDTKKIEDNRYTDAYCIY